MDRIYLCVAPEEYPEVKTCGACWDDASKSWYIGEGMAPAMFSRWLEEERGEAPFSIRSEEAFVVSARSACVSCAKDMEVICIHCRSGIDTEIGEPLSDFTVSNIAEMDGGLAKMLLPWPDFRKAITKDSQEGNFANHCPHCGAVQEDYLLHSEPGDVFFGIAMGGPGAVRFTPLVGHIELSGDYGFEV